MTTRTEPIGKRAMPGMRHIILVLAALAGCGGTGANGPGSAIERYRAALERKDFAVAYDLMSSSFRARHTREEFVRMMEEHPGEVGETVAQLGRPHQEVEIRAELRYGQDERLRLVREDDRWHIATNPIRFYGQATPREVLRSFLRAHRLERWDVMLRLVPDRYREHMDADMLRQQFQGEHRDDMTLLMGILEANAEEPITEKGNEARMPYGERYEVEFIREDGLWKILDID